MGWLFSAPAVLGLIVFLLIPIIAAVWVSFRDWNGIAPIFDSDSVGLANYRELLTDDGVRRTDFAISLRNNLYYVLGVVPIQTIIAFVIAVILNQKFLKGKGFFRTAYYFPSITSSIAVTLIFVFLFQTNGAVNRVLPIQDIDWLDNARGVIHNFLGVFGVEEGPAFLTENEFMGLELWDWLAGPSVAMVAIMMLVTWTSVGTFMLIFLAGLQNISPSVEEAAVVDGANAFQRFFRITVPLMRPTIFFVVTLGLIGTWQVFDQVYAGTAGGPRKTTFTPAYLIYFQAFTNSKAGLAAAIAVILFAIIMFFTWVNRQVIRDTGDF
ncbi:MAG TPA: sugar ABC transporter permease [Acidimicrobiia bacterium]|nr:sugar ABC transporter permease [Acidimicrobiia bacterium]